MACPGSPRVIALLPPEEREPKSADARRGDERHLLVERSIVDDVPPARYVGGSPMLLEGRDYNALPMAERAYHPTTEDAASADHVYQHVVAQCDPAGGTVQVDVEQRIDIGPQLGDSRFDPETLSFVIDPLGVRMQGRTDVLIRGPGYVEVIDYKAGVRHVSEVGNLQMLSYLIGVAPDLDSSIEVARLTIAQPGSIRTDVPPVRTWEIPMVDLPGHRVRLTDGARRCQDPDAPLVPGEHCAATYCPARGSCPALAAVSAAVLTSTPGPGVITAPAGEPGGLGAPEEPVRLPVGNEAVPGDLAFALAKRPDELTIDQLADIIDAEEMIRSWIKAVHSHAYKLAMRGTRIPRHKLGVGSRSKKWKVGEEELRTRLSRTGKIGEDGKAHGKLKKPDYLTETIVSPAQALARVKPLVTARSWKAIEELWEWTDGPPVLVSESSSRAEYVVESSAEAFGLETCTANDANDGGGVQQLNLALPDFLK